MRIAVVGAGAVGGYFGARLAAAGEDVAFLARGERLRAMRKAGVRVQSVHGDLTVPASDLTVTDDPARIGPADVVLFTVKSYDTVQAAASLSALLGPETGVISLQNGIDNEEELAAAIGAKHVVGGVAYILANSPEPGLVVHTGGPTRIVVGELDGQLTPRVAQFHTACLRAGFAADISDAILVELWTKWAFICAQAGLTAATRMPIGVIRETPETWLLFRAVLDEVWRIGRATGIALPDDLVERHAAFAQTLEPHARSSLFDDLQAGRRMELDALLGEVVRRGDAAGEPVPVARALVGILRPWQRHNESLASRPGQ